MKKSIITFLCLMLITLSGCTYNTKYSESDAPLTITGGLSDTLIVYYSFNGEERELARLLFFLSQLKQKPDDYINVAIEFDDMDITSADTKAIYDEIKKYVAEHNAGMKVSNLYISQVKRKCGIEVGKNYNLPKNEDSRQPQCPEDKESAIVEALKHFNIIYSKNSPSSTGGR